jgi:hypothetical protein
LYTVKLLRKQGAYGNVTVGLTQTCLWAPPNSTNYTQTVTNLSVQFKTGEWNKDVEVFLDGKCEKLLLNITSTSNAQIDSLDFALQHDFVFQPPTPSTSTDVPWRYFVAVGVAGAFVVAVVISLYRRYRKREEERKRKVSIKVSLIEASLRVNLQRIVVMPYNPYNVAWPVSIPIESLNSEGSRNLYRLDNDSSSNNDAAGRNPTRPRCKQMGPYQGATRRGNGSAV